MKKLINISGILAILLLLSVQVKAQDIRYSQPFTNPLNLNPALMELTDEAKIMLSTRNQFSSYYKTYSFTGYCPVVLEDKGNKLDIGLNVYLDQAGAFQTIYPSLAIGYRLKVANANYLSFALAGAYVQKTLTTTDLTFDDQYVLGEYSGSNISGEIFSDEKISYPEVNFGILWNTNFTKADGALLNAFAGISGFHMNKPNESFIEDQGILPSKYSFQAGVKFIGDGKVNISPNVIVSTQSGCTDAAIGVYIDYKFNEKSKLTFGTWYRNKDAIAPLLRLEIMNCALGYSYDIPASDMGRTLPGLNTHEISLIYKINMSKTPETPVLF